MRIEAAIEDYLASLEAEGKARGTIDVYRRDLGRLREVLGDREVGSITPTDLLAYAASPVVRLQADGTPRHQTTINRGRSAVRGLFAFLIRAWVVTADPSKVLRVRAATPPQASVLSTVDEAKLVEAVEAGGDALARRDLLMVRLLLATGIRISSLVALDRKDIDVENERMSILAKGGRRLVVKLDRDLGEELRALVDSGPLFCSRRGGRISARQVQFRFTAWVEAAGIGPEITPHSLRHTFGTRTYAATKDLRRTQVAMGHRSSVTTERYVAV